MLKEKIEGYREGIVAKEALADWNCHVAATNEKEVFRYIEIFCENGVRYYVYEDEKGYALFCVLYAIGHTVQVKNCFDNVQPQTTASGCFTP